MRASGSTEKKKVQSFFHRQSEEKRQPTVLEAEKERESEREEGRELDP